MQIVETYFLVSYLLLPFVALGAGMTMYNEL